MIPVALVAASLLAAASATADVGRSLATINHGRPIVDAHNCYPYDGQWADRIDRALKAGLPVSIEQDLAWYVDPRTGRGRVVVSHTATPTGAEPALEAYFFDRVRPIVERALREGRRADWPLIVLHLDFKDSRPELLHAVWNLLGEYQPWLSTAVKTADAARLSPIESRPILVVTEDADAQAKVFDDEVPVGARLRLFGSAHTTALPATAPLEKRAAWAIAARPDQLLTAPATNYRRWWNGTWWEVEAGGENKAGDWTAADSVRLKALVQHAHGLGYWVRFYTLDGFDAADNHGWFADYNFGSLDRAALRWRAAMAAEVNFIASDQYEELSHHIAGVPRAQRRLDK